MERLYAWRKSARCKTFRVTLANEWRLLQIRSIKFIYICRIRIVAYTVDHCQCSVYSRTWRNAPSRAAWCNLMRGLDGDEDASTLPLNSYQIVGLTLNCVYWVSHRIQLKSHEESPVFRFLHEVAYPCFGISFAGEAANTPPLIGRYTGLDTAVACLWDIGGGTSSHIACTQE